MLKCDWNVLLVVANEFFTSAQNESEQHSLLLVIYQHNIIAGKAARSKHKKKWMPVTYL